MARRRKMTPERRAFINGLLEHYQPTDAQDVQEMLPKNGRIALWRRNMPSFSWMPFIFMYEKIIER